MTRSDVKSEGKKANGPDAETLSNEPIKIGDVPLTALVQPIDFSGVATSGTPTGIQIGKPRGDEWVTARPGDEWGLTTNVIEDKQEFNREIYIVTSDLANGPLSADAHPAILRLATSSTGRLFWWYVKIGTANRRNPWAESALKAITMAHGRWIRVIPSHGGYELREAIAAMPDPQWPDLEREQAITLAFEDRVIDSMDHPVAKRLTLGG